MLEQGLLGVVDIFHGNGRFSGGSSSSGGSELGDGRHLVGLAGLGISGFRRVQLHDPLILLAPLRLHLLELGLADDVLDSGGEVTRHSAHPADPIADRSHDLGQVLGTDEDQCENRDDRELGGIDAEHAGSLAAVTRKR